jgi:hypothetical protein
MSSSNRDRNDRYIANTRNYVDIAMGTLYIFIGIYMVKVPTLTARFGKNSVFIFLGLFCAYGLYRVAKGAFAILKSNRNQRPRRHL